MNTLRVMAVVTAALLASGIGRAAFAQDRLGVSSRKPSVDGTIIPNEYTYSHDFDRQMTLYVTRTPTTLYLAVVGQTAGWVAVGVGQRMDGAAIFMGYVKGGKAVFNKPQLGRGHFHQDAPVDISDTVQKYALKERGGKTTLEVALKAAAYIKSGQSALDLVFAMGDQASFTQYHSYRNLTSLTLE